MKGRNDLGWHDRLRERNKSGLTATSTREVSGLVCSEIETRMSGYVRIDECGNRARREGYSTVLKAARKSQGRVSNGLALGSPWPPRTTVGMNGVSCVPHSCTRMHPLSSTCRWGRLGSMSREPTRHRSNNTTLIILCTPTTPFP